MAIESTVIANNTVGVTIDHVDPEAGVTILALGMGQVIAAFIIGGIYLAIAKNLGRIVGERLISRRNRRRTEQEPATP